MNQPDHRLQTHLVTKDEYNHSKSFISGLRSPSDPKPVLILPQVSEDARPRHCLMNSVDFCEKNPGYEPVFGFKLWKLTASEPYTAAVASDPFMAAVHVVAYCKETDTYVDVTPPEPGDEGQKVIYVPSSRIYKGWTVWDIASYSKNDLQVRMGSICCGKTLALHHMLLGETLYKSTPEELNLMICPKMSAMQKHLFNMQRPHLQMFLEKLGTVFIEEKGTMYCLVDANDYRRLYQETERVWSELGSRDSMFGHGVEEACSQ